MIQQHCYTKAKKGYDTVACSPGLSEAFVKERLHPFCDYHPSRILQAKRVPAAEFPRALTVIQFPEKKMLLGQTIYVEPGPTGGESTFFTHNYVLPRPDKLLPEDIGHMLYRTVFLTESDWEQLPELEELPLHKGETPSVGPLPFDKKRLLQLIYVLLEAVTGTRKVYVVLPDLEWVNPMLMWLYSQLPHPAQQALGFTTYSRKTENKKFLHLIFMDKGSLDPDEDSLDYFLDFDSGYFSKNMLEVSEKFLQERIKSFTLK